MDTSINTLSRVVGRMGDMAAGHHPITVLEVAGRSSGGGADGGVALGAEIVVTPEQGDLTADKILKIAQRFWNGECLRGQRHAIVLVAEGVELDPCLVHPR